MTATDANKIEGVYDVDNQSLTAGVSPSSLSRRHLPSLAGSSHANGPPPPPRRCRNARDGPSAIDAVVARHRGHPDRRHHTRRHRPSVADAEVVPEAKQHDDGLKLGLAMTWQRPRRTCIGGAPAWRGRRDGEQTGEDAEERRIGATAIAACRAPSSSPISLGQPPRGPLGTNTDHATMGAHGIGRRW